MAFLIIDVFLLGEVSMMKQLDIFIYFRYHIVPLCTHPFLLWFTLYPLVSTIQ